MSITTSNIYACMQIIIIEISASTIGPQVTVSPPQLQSTLHAMKGAES